MNYKLKIAHGPKIRASSRMVTQFSDSVVVSYKASEWGGLSDILYDVLQLQLKLVSRGLWVRGAVARGLLYHQKDFVFGPALVEAAELEKLAMYPRVIVDRTLVDEAGLGVRGEPGATQDAIAAVDLDGMCFVDYFGVSPSSFADWGEAIEYLIDLRQAIVGLANKRSPSLRLKYSWLKKKFNDVSKPIEKSKHESWNGETAPEDEVPHFMNIQSIR